MLLDVEPGPAVLDLESRAWVLLRPILLEFEGLYLSPYLCPAGVWTIGLGTTRYPDGRPVGPRDPRITKEQAWVIAKHQMINDYMAEAIELCPGQLNTAGRLAAISDFCYNAGVPAFRSSTLRRKINQGDWDAVPGQLKRWNKGGGRVLCGLVRRRAMEIAILSRN